MTKRAYNDSEGETIQLSLPKFDSEDTAKGIEIIKIGVENGPEIEEMVGSEDIFL